MYLHAEPVLPHYSTSTGYYLVVDGCVTHSYISICCCDCGNGDCFSTVALLFARSKEVSIFDIVGVFVFVVS